jgi:hypothetical protein
MTGVVLSKNTASSEPETMEQKSATPILYGGESQVAVCRRLPVRYSNKTPNQMQQ